MLQEQAEDPGGDRGDNEKPAELRIEVFGGDAAIAEAATDSRTIRIQSRQKNPSSTSAVARCVATRNVTKYASFWWMSQPSSSGGSRCARGWR